MPTGQIEVRAAARQKAKGCKTKKCGPTLHAEINLASKIEIQRGTKLK